MKTNQQSYENLLLQYEKLDDIEKNAILIYKSKLFVIINEISKIPSYKDLNANQITDKLYNKEECINIFNSYSKILNDLRNSFIKNTVFSNIRFDNFYNFIDDLKTVINILNNISFKINLEEDMVVYRSILVDKDRKFDFINDSPAFISTSIKVEDAETFLNGNNNSERHFYSIKLPKGMPVIVSPFSIVRKYDSFVDSINPDSTYALAVSNRGITGQQEIILLRDLINFKEINNKTINDEGYNVNIHYGEVSLKDNIYFDSQQIIK